MRSILSIPNMHSPTLTGSKAIPIDFATGVTIGDLVAELESLSIRFIQSIWIDNSNNAAAFLFNIAGMGNSGQTIKAPPFSQGYYQVTPQHADGFRFTATAGGAVPVILYNIPMPYNVWLLSAAAAAALTSAPLSFAALAAGDNVFGPAAVAAKSVSIYTALFDVAGATNVQFFDGPSAGALPLTGVMTLTAAGSSITFPPMGTPWLVSSPGNAVVMTSSNAVNMGGIVRYAQA